MARRQYRFRIINASNARFYNLKLSNGMSFTQIGGDGSYLPSPVTLTESLVSPAERVDILIDFSNRARGHEESSSRTPPISHSLAATRSTRTTTGQVMRFDVQDTRRWRRIAAADADHNSDAHETDGIGNPKLFTLNEHESAIGEPLAVLIDGQHFDSPITETAESRHDGGVVLPEPD